MLQGSAENVSQWSEEEVLARDLQTVTGKDYMQPELALKRVNLLLHDAS